MSEPFDVMSKIDPDYAESFDRKSQAMSDDLVERLRIWPAAYGEDAMSSTYVGKMAKDAADEIERLRALVKAQGEEVRITREGDEAKDDEIAKLRYQLAKAKSALEPFVGVTITPQGAIIGLERVDFERAKAALTDEIGK